MTMTFIIRDLDLPWSIILAKIEFTFDSLREDALLYPKLERFCSFFLGISFDNSNSMEKIPMTNPIN